MSTFDYESNNDVSDFLDNFTSNSFSPCIVQPTRISSTSRTLIDNIFTNFLSDELISGNLTISISDHFGQFLLLKIRIISYIYIIILKYIGI